MRIAITGGNGYLGKALSEKLERRLDVDTRILTIDTDSKGDYIYTDFSTDSLTEHLKGMDVVVHLAAVRGGKSITDFFDNERITENLLLSMKAANVSRFVFVSSIAVYSDETLLPWKEDQVCKPVSLYGISKLACENLFLHYAERFGFDGVILRLSPVYGQYDRNKRMIANFIHQAANGDVLRVNGRSISKRDFIYRDDAAAALEFGIYLGNTGVTVINIGSGEHLTNLEIANKINRAFGEKHEINYLSDRSENMSAAYSDLSKAEAAGFRPAFNLEAALKIIAPLEGERLRDVSELH